MVWADVGEALLIVPYRQLGEPSPADGRLLQLHHCALLGLLLFRHSQAILVVKLWYAGMKGHCRRGWLAVTAVGLHRLQMRGPHRTTRLPHVLAFQLHDRQVPERSMQGTV